MRHACLMLAALLPLAGCAAGGTAMGTAAPAGAPADAGRMAVAAFAEICMNLDPAEIDRRARRFGYGEVTGPNRPATLTEGTRMYLRPSPAGPSVLFSSGSEALCEMAAPNIEGAQMEAAFAEFVGFLARSPQLTVSVMPPDQVATAAAQPGRSRLRYAAIVMPAAVAPVPASALILRANPESRTPYHVMLHRQGAPRADAGRAEQNQAKDPVPAR